MTRPAVDVVVPFRGDRAELADLTTRLAALELRAGDSLVVVDNTPGESREGTVHAAELETPAYARNRGAARGQAEWLVFFDADVTPQPDLLDRYFDPVPAERTALLGGEVVDEPVPRGGPPAARYGYLAKAMSQDRTFGLGRWSFPQTANAACRREAFEAVGGFREELRAAEDADLTYRLRAAGWEVERRERAAVVHRSRQTVRGFVAQRLQHGAGAGWLENTYPGSSPGHRRPGLVWWGLRFSLQGLITAIRTRQRDEALLTSFEALELISREFGRSLPNERARLR